MLRVWLATSLLTWSFTFCVEDAQTYIFECIYLEYAYEVDILIFYFFCMITLYMCMFYCRLIQKVMKYRGLNRHKDDLNASTWFLEPGG